MMLSRRKFVKSLPLNSFLRESGRLYLLYMTAGIAAIPAVAIYAVLAAEGYRRWWTAVPAIALAFLMAVKAWQYVDRKLFTKESSVTASGMTWSFNEVSLGVPVPLPATAVVAMIFSLTPATSPARPILRITQQPVPPGIVLTIPEGEIEPCSERTEKPELTYEYEA